MKLKVGYRSIAIGPMPEGVYESSNHLGEFRRGAGTITVYAGQPVDELADTIIHEVLHAIWAERELGQKVEEEAAVTALAHGLTAVFKDNPEFAAVWLKCLAGRKPAFLT